MFASAQSHFAHKPIRAFDAGTIRNRAPVADVANQCLGESRVAPHLDSAEHWRQLAAEARAVAAQLADRDAKQIMLNIAEAYERLALHAEARTQDPD
jgi:hypothetical protein